MIRKLKHHEQKLLKKVDFVDYKNERPKREIEVVRRYRIQNREDYHKYNKICGYITKLSNILKQIDPNSPIRQNITKQLLNKLYEVGLINRETSLNECDKIPVSTFCRRRLPVVMVVRKMAETLQQAITLIEQGHVRVGPEVITDPAYIVTRNLEDFVTWVDNSKIKQHIMKFNDKLDDFDLLGI